MCYTIYRALHVLQRRNEMQIYLFEHVKHDCDGSLVHRLTTECYLYDLQTRMLYFMLTQYRDYPAI